MTEKRPILVAETSLKHLIVYKGKQQIELKDKLKETIFFYYEHYFRQFALLIS
ncbi:hypothetical protein [Propionispora vibrioides]|uniref:hypothetical protein n=1 Tax=Propionispora vibrioides TaxID=112903 RepID=UPI001C431B53|nr:hypothetical protein [Propionispora vibrioides]